MKIVGIILLVILVLTLVGFLVIWSLNTLFGLGLAYSLKNVISAMVLSAIVSGNNRSGD